MSQYPNPEPAGLSSVAQGAVGNYPAFEGRLHVFGRVTLKGPRPSCQLALVTQVRNKSEVQSLFFCNGSSTARQLARNGTTEAFVVPFTGWLDNGPGGLSAELQMPEPQRTSPIV